MVLDYSRNFGNAAKEGVKRTTHLATYYFTNPNSWYPVPERAMILLAIPAIQLLTPVPMAPQSIQKMRDWALTTMTKAGTSLEIKPGQLVSVERSDFEEQRENSGKQDEEEDGIFDYDSPIDDGDIPSLEQGADFHLGRGSRFARSIRFNSRTVFI
ncbi:unnamed protein product [Pocillopora meandrina]|uniref:Uncharacterized protein n=1 Tax=Pocillopora meandrina TaxID=46732 RepID=A0AAU9XNB5_9CNID|nr:unnamed protein product [Pocillopora meandrina]